MGSVCAPPAPDERCKSCRHRGADIHTVSPSTEHGVAVPVVQTTFSCWDENGEGSLVLCIDVGRLELRARIAHVDPRNMAIQLCVSSEMAPTDCPSHRSQADATRHRSAPSCVRESLHGSVDPQRSGPLRNNNLDEPLVRNKSARMGISSA